MLDATQRSSAETVVDIFEFMDLDPAVNDVVHEDGLRYHRHPNGRFGSDILLDIYTFGLSASECVIRAQGLAGGVPHWVEPFGDIDEPDARLFAEHGYASLGDWTVMRRPLLERPARSDIPVKLVTDAETEAMLAALQNERSDVGHRVKPGQYRDDRFIQCWIPVDGVVAAIGQAVIVQELVYVCEMITFPDFRRRGFAGAIFQELLRHAYDRGVREAILVSTPMAHNLYQAQGFADVVGIRVFEWFPPAPAS